MRHLVLAFCASLLAAGPAAATQNAYPALYDVTGVAEDDVLNVRTRPDPSSRIIGTLPPDATNIEVVEHEPHVDWGRVNIDGRSGWVSLHYMARHPNQFVGAFPEIARCAGTEPFWSVTRDGMGYRFNGPDRDETRFVREWSGTAQGRRDPHAMTLTSRPGTSSAEATAVISYEACSDGMSDKRFGLSLDFILRIGEQPELLSGCCSLEP